MSAALAGETVATLVDRVSRQFESAGLAFGHGFESAWDESVALVLSVTGLADDRSELDRAVTASDVARVDDLAGRRIAERVPLAYLIGACHYMGERFLVEPGTVIPRSPIGAMVANDLAPWLARFPERVLDLCCGGGCLGILAARRFAGARVDLVDLSPQAVALARRNVDLHGLGGRVRVQESDLFDNMPAGQWDLILCNPPYVDATDMTSLPAEHRHEPPTGLAGGRDGLDLVARMLDALPERLAPGGLFVCEVGASAPALTRRYPRLPLLWPDLPHGGEGVFLLAL